MTQEFGSAMRIVLSTHDSKPRTGMVEYDHFKIDAEELLYKLSNLGNFCEKSSGVSMGNGRDVVSIDTLLN